MHKKAFNSQERRQKKIIDLIYLDNRQIEYNLKNDYQTRIQTWMKWLDRKLNSVVDEDISIEEQSEYFMVNNFFKNFLTRRINWIFESVPDNDLKKKYLLAIPPFNQVGGIKSFLLHFFQFRDSKRGDIIFRYLNHSEREVRILWDVYKMVKTLETINVLKNAVKGSDPFPSEFSADHIQKTLNSMRDVLTLLVQICFKTGKNDELLTDFPIEVFDPDAILNRKKSEEYLINHNVLERFDYRNYFFHIYFRSSMKAIFQGHELSYRLNYLDFEIIRQEFLIHWINVRLRNNPRKKEVLDRTMIGSKSFSEVTGDDPESEISYLKQLPKHVFDELISEVNEAVGEEDQAPIDPMSERAGTFAAQFKSFQRAKILAQKTVQKIQEFISQRKSRDEVEAVAPKNGNDAKNSAPVQLKSTYMFKILKESDIDFPFFCQVNSRFGKQLSLMQSKMSPAKYESMDRQIQEYISSIGRNNLVTRRIPRHEWTIPFLIRETVRDETFSHLLIMGVEVKHKQLGMGYASGLDESYSMKSYFVYGSREQTNKLGDPAEKRMVRDEEYSVYSSSKPEVIEKAVSFIDLIIQQMPTTD